MIQIGVPDTPHSQQDLSLSSQFTSIELTFNSLDKLWRVNLYVDGELAFSGLTVVEPGFLLSNYSSAKFQGELVCLRLKNDAQPVGRHNFGVGKAYGLFYVSPSELLEITA